MDLLQIVENALQALIAGLLLGVVYGLMCSGLSLIFGVLRVINFAQGEFMMLGMYAALFLCGAFGTLHGPAAVAAPLLAALAAGPPVFLFGYGLHRTLIRRVTGLQGGRLDAQGHHAQLILTLGLALILQNGALLLFGSEPRSIATPLSYSAWELGPLYADRVLLFVNQNQVATALLALGCIGALLGLLARTRLGRVLRAAADHAEAATYMGIDVDRVHAVGFALGVALTAIGGGLLASSYPFQPYVGLEYVMLMYTGVVLGGLGSVGGAFLGGLAIGVVQQLAAVWLPVQLQNAALFGCFLLVILLRPNGLFGRAARSA